MLGYRGTVVAGVVCIHDAATDSARGLLRVLSLLAPRLVVPLFEALTLEAFHFALPPPSLIPSFRMSLTHLFVYFVHPVLNLDMIFSPGLAAL